MSWTVEWARRARKDMRKLDEQAARRVGRKVQRYATLEHGDVKKLRDVDPPQWRLRVGDCRVFFRFDSARQVLMILRVRHRSKAYE